MPQLVTQWGRLLIRRFSWTSFLARHVDPIREPRFEWSDGVWNQVRILTSRGRLDEAFSLFYSVPPPPATVRFQSVYASLFQACAHHGYYEEGTRLHQYMLHYNLNNTQSPFLTNHVINLYAKQGDMEYACQLFDEMPQRNLVSWTVLISGFAQLGQSYECFCLLSDMLMQCRPNEFAFASVLTCCSHLRGRQVHALALKMAMDASVYVGNALISMYSRNGVDGSDAGDAGDRDPAWIVFYTMKFRNIVSWNSMLATFRIRSQNERAVSFFCHMHSTGVGIDRASLLCVLSSLGALCCDELDSGVHLCSHLHCLCVKSRFVINIEVVTALVKAYADLGGEAGDCYRLFSEVGSDRDIVSWTGLITAFAESEPAEAFFLFRQLCREGFVPDWFTFSSILKACAGFPVEKHVSVVHSQVIRHGLDCDSVIANVLIHAYARCGFVYLSNQVFLEMKNYNLISWNSMLKAFALHGQAKEALQLFSQMDINPDSTTMIALLSACSHGGLVEEGIDIFESMHSTHHISPQLNHYACIVDILGRAGRVQEAMGLVHKMPMEPDFVIWSALLGSCRKHGETKLAELAASRLRDLQPRRSLGFVQMSNIYCSGGSYDQAGHVRKQMEGCRVRKEPGLSWIEIDNEVHELASGGWYHPERTAICAKLDALVGQLKEMGYVPETSLALHDVEEEQKEEQLLRHGEKLALAFALIRGANQKVVRIMKNIRICVDCHHFMKLASKHLRREIVVRDANRFHHFCDGSCSCSDYW